MFVNVRYIIIMMGIAFVGLSILNCAKSNPDAPLPGHVHAINYTNPEAAIFHGIEVNFEGVDDCKSCHGIGLNGTNTIPGCYDCHFDPQGSQAPPGSDWVHGLDGHLSYAAYLEVCNNCHASVRRFGLPPEYCHDCHGAGLNHALGQAWLDKNSADFHGGSALTDCNNCHDLTQKCFECHFGENGSKSPPGSGWTHGNNDEHKERESDQSTCNRCHNLNRSYGNDPIACHDCHRDD